MPSAQGSSKLSQTYCLKPHHTAKATNQIRAIVFLIMQ